MVFRIIIFPCAFLPLVYLLLLSLITATLFGCEKKEEIENNTVSHIEKDTVQEETESVQEEQEPGNNSCETAPM